MTVEGDEEQGAAVGSGSAWRATRLCVAVFVALGALASCSSDSSSTATDESLPAASTTTTRAQPTQTIPAKTRYVVDGQSVNLTCRGRGRIPVVFQAGGRERGDVWNDLISSLGPDVFTCVFDRPGTTDAAATAAPPPEYTTPRQVATQLNEALRMAGVGPRVVLVGHSSGGMDALVFGAEYPDRVAGAVLFDPAEPNGITDRSEWSRIGFDAEAAVQQTRAVTEWPDVPLVVLSGDSQLAITAGEATAAEQAEWIEGHRRYAALSPQGVQREVPGTNHFVYLTAPEEARAAVRQVLRDAD